MRAQNTDRKNRKGQARISKVWLSCHPKNQSEAQQLYLALRKPCREAGIALSWATGSVPPRSSLPQRDQATPAIIAIIGSDGSAPWDAEGRVTDAMVTEGALIVPVLIQCSSDTEIPAPIRQRSALAFELSLSDSSSLARLISAIRRLEGPVNRMRGSLPEEIVNPFLESTIRFYEENARKFIDAHEEDIPKALLAQIFSFVSQVERRRRPTETARILDAGCGPGHHTRFFAKCGFTAIGIDRCSRFIEHATGVSKGDCSFVEGDMRTLDSYFSPDYQFDGIWANASCVHLPRSVVASLLDQFGRFLRPNGVLGISFQLGMSTLQREGRFFERYDADEPAEMLRRHGFTVVEALEDEVKKSTTGRARTKRWLSLVALPPVAERKLDMRVPVPAEKV